MVPVTTCETTTSTPSLLETLRNHKSPPRNDHEMTKLVLDHRHEFPLRIREAIDQESTRQLAPRAFLSEIHRSVKTLVFGYHEETVTHQQQQHQPWRGLDSSVDTEDEVEVAIRVFPSLLKDKGIYKRGPHIHYSYALYAVLSSLKSFPFVPLVADLEATLEDEHPVAKQQQHSQKVFVRGTFDYKIKSALFELVRGWPILKQSDDDDDDQHGRKVDELAVDVLAKLQAKGLLKREVVSDFDLVWQVLFSKSHESSKQRLRFLLEWDPYVLKDDGRGCRLLFQFLRRQDGCEDNPQQRTDALQRFTVIFELGMKYFPDELGFLFYKEGSSCNSSFRIACRLFGTTTITAIVEDAIRKTAGRNKTTAIHAALLLETASNENILLDGVYFLFRRDPILSSATTTTTTPVPLSF